MSPSWLALSEDRRYRLLLARSEEAAQVGAVKWIVLRGGEAYEIKIRVTIAASGQGRWGEELSFPADCKASKFTPVLLVLDGTENSKLSELARTFRQHGGSAYVGEDAWAHLEAEAGPTMSVFIEKYIRGPFDELLERTPTDIPELRVRLRSDSIHVQIGAETLDIKRGGPNTPNESLF